jgi:coproporphyrinogen III oxidase-like Fe-S oxidoreductase
MFGDYLGVGAGAHGKLTLAASGAIVRTLQLREPRRYLAQVPAAVARKNVSPHELPFEFMLNALRLVDGFDAAMFSQRTGLDWEAVADPVNTLVGRGLLIREGTSHRPSPRGMGFLNELLLSFMSDVRPEIAKMTDAFGLSTASQGI